MYIQNFGINYVMIKMFVMIVIIFPSENNFSSWWKNKKFCFLSWST